MTPFRLVASLALAAAVAGCATTAMSPDEAIRGDPLVLALTSPVQDLRERAESGDSVAQFGLSVILAEGLRGQTQDPEAGSYWRERAFASPGAIQITQYIPGIDGAPGQVHLLQVPKAGYPRFLGEMNDACIAQLKGHAADAASFFSGMDFPIQPGSFESYEARHDAAALVCGGEERYGLLTHLWEEAQPWTAHPLPDCPDDNVRCRILAQKIARLNSRDPAEEARTAAAQGDYRLHGFNHIGPMPQGWSLPGVTCSTWSRDMIDQWHVNQDVVGDGDREHTDASVGFITVFNRTMVTAPTFPFADVCSETLVEPAPAYAGPVTTFAQAARSGVVTSVEAMTREADVNARDEFGLTALEWAMQRQDEPMTRALIEAGADPSLHAERDLPPLARALMQDRFELAQLMLAHGARMTAAGSFCDEPPFGSLYAPQGETSQPTQCGWAGLLIAKGQYDILDQQAALGGLNAQFDPSMMTDGRPDWGDQVVLDSRGELLSHLYAAVERNDEQAITRLLPHAGARGGSPYVIERLYQENRPDLVRQFVLGRGADAARSDAEAEVWRAAAEAGADDALAFVRDYGADLNFLTRPRLDECVAAAGSDDVESLLGCIEEAGARRLALHAAITDGDMAGFSRGIAEAADIRERMKTPLVLVAADRGDPEMVAALIAAGVDVAGISGSPQFEAAYTGAFAAQAEAIAEANGYADTLLVRAGTLTRAAERGETAMLRMLLDAGATGLPAVFQRLSNVGNEPPGFERNLFGGAADNEHLPGHWPETDMEVLDLVAAEIARIHGPQALEDAFRGAAYSGYTDVMALILRNGFDASQAERPERIWASWAGLSSPCKPSMGRLLLEAGLPIDHAPNEFTHWPPLHQVAVGCADPEAARMLVEEGGIDVNAMDTNGDTPLDLLEHRSYREEMAAMLRSLGGQTAEMAHPAQHQTQVAERRAEIDYDLVQSETQ